MCDGTLFDESPTPLASSGFQAFAITSSLTALEARGSTGWPMGLVRHVVILLVTSALCHAFPRAYTLRHTRRRVQSMVAADLVLSAGKDLVGPLVLVSSGSLLLLNEEEGLEGEGLPVAADTELEPTEVDVFRDTPLRYFGYSNEFGEAFAPLVPLPWFLLATYVVSIGYVLADTADKGYRALSGGRYIDNIGACAAIESADAGIWQLGASVALPGLTIHQLVAASALLEEAFGLPPDGTFIARALPTVVGLLSIPVIIKPLDELAEKLMDWTLRRLWSPFLESCSIDAFDT